MRNKPIIIAHRGASGFRPEHTFASYSLAIDLGADYIEPDLVFTKDGHLICRHENEISQTTNIADFQEFASRKTIKTIDGNQIEGWFTEDFTLAELKTLKCKERLPDLRKNNTKFDGKFEIKTFEELLQFRAQKSEEKGRIIGIYPETKHPSYFANLGFEFNKPIIDLCNKYNLNSKDSPIFIQSFETWNLKEFNQTCDMKLIQLMTKVGGPWDNQVAPNISYKDLFENKIAEIASYAYGVGPEKTFIIPRDETANSIAPSDFVQKAHEYKLHVHPWTFRSENFFLPKELRNTTEGKFGDEELGEWLREYNSFLELGIDGLFTDFTNHAYYAINEFIKNTL